MVLEQGCKRDSTLILLRAYRTSMVHDVNEDEAIEVLERPMEDRNGREGARVALGQTSSGRYLRVIYVPDEELGSVFVVTAYELTGKPLSALRRRRKKKQPVSRQLRTVAKSRFSRPSRTGPVRGGG